MKTLLLALAFVLPGCFAQTEQGTEPAPAPDCSAACGWHDDPVSGLANCYTSDSEYANTNHVEDLDASAGMTCVVSESTCIAKGQPAECAEVCKRTHVACQPTE